MTREELVRAVDLYVKSELKDFGMDVSIYAYDDISGVIDNIMSDVNDRIGDYIHDVNDRIREYNNTVDSE